MPERHHLRQFLVLVFVLLIPCFALWQVAAGPLATPAIGFVNSLLGYWLPNVVDTLYVDGKAALLMTNYGEQGGQLIPLTQAEYQLGFSVETRIVSYCLPFFTALHFATPRTDYFNSWVLGLLLLYPLIAFGLLAMCLKELMVGLGSAFLQQPGVWIPDANLIALFYQINVLIVPVVAPAAIWLFQSRRTPLLRDVMGRLESATNPRDTVG